ncbi:hypothetical protein [Chryseobacterium sp. JK1]|uniref:hypothetical protein n=1 Tax=Chryseobacterium sp. JK1 TaxID=874294 RepID=UPI003D69F04C
MKKTLILAMVFLGISSVFAFPFRSSCGIVFQINKNYAANVTTEALTSTLMGLNMSACGVRPAHIVYYIS